jgi:hypothetical protein
MKTGEPASTVFTVKGGLSVELGLYVYQGPLA